LSIQNEYVREIFIYGNEFWRFYESQNSKTQKKIDWTIDLVRTLEKIPEQYFKHLEGTNGLYEIRVKLGTNIFRIFSFFDEGRLVILLNGFQKKTQKTPKNEIKKALKLKDEYYESK